MVKTELIALSALLHDIGKFTQLGGKSESEGEKKLMAEFNLQNGSSHSHAICSATFIKQHFKNGKEDVSQLVLYHHFPEKAPEAIRIDAMRLALADWLANGKCRGNEQIISDEAYARPLVSIFSQIFKDKNNSPNRYVKPSVLDLNLTDLFPKPISEFSTDVIKEEFKKLWQQFDSEFEKINLSLDFEKYFLTILNLLEKFAITIPAISEKPEQDITLYHHLKTTTAIAACLVHLTDGEIEQAYATIKENKLSNKMLSEPSFYLVGGDISGIQDFIYSVTSEHALKGLRGRSFYLQLISEAVAKSILDKFGLTLANVLYIGGGHFFLLLPKKENIAEELNQIIEIVDHNLLEAHHGKLALVIGKKELSYMDFLGAGFGKAFHLLKKEISVAKRRKFASLLKAKTDIQRIMKLDVGGEQQVCEICSDELTEEEQQIAKQRKSRQCFFCESYSNLAYDLGRCKFLIEKKVPSNFKKYVGQFKSYDEVLRYFGYEFNLSEIKTESDTNLLINSSDFISNSSICDGFKFLPKHTKIINSKKEKKEHVKTLEEFANDAEGIKRWGVFRADVDHLGKIFKEGLGDNQTITNISMLSYFVSLFFSAQVEYIARENFKDTIYIIYSGGDDMFALGSWSDLPDFAMKIRESFIHFTGNNPAIRISGGIYIAPSEKFPVYQAADSAGNSLEKSKNDGRDRLTFFDSSIKWNEFENVQKLTNKIINLLNGKNKVSRSLLQILYSAWEEKENSEDEKKGYPIFRFWRILHSFKRFQERHSKRSSEIMALATDITINKYNLKSYLNLSTKWAELLTRKER